MKLILTLFILLFLSFQSVVYSQLPDGSIAPNWTLTDIDGNTHTLYDYLDQGKMVVIEFSATWCGPCWNYMLTGALEDFWDEHGPDGADDAMVFYIEADQSTGMADLLGQTPGSQGNWVEAIPFPIIDLQVGENTDNEYQVNYYPTLYAVCHDATIYELGQVPAETWSNFVQSCSLEAEAGDIEPALCVGEGSASVEATGGFPPLTYYWNTGATTQTITGLSGGNYSVTVTEAYGKIATVEIFVPGATEPVSITDVSIEPALCYGYSNGNVFLDVEGGTPGYLYDWSNGASTQDLLNVYADNYTVTITDDNGCTLQQSFSVDEPDEIEVDLETTTENCDQSDGTITLSISGGVGDYEISASDGTIYGNQIVDLPAGDVSVEVEDENGCIWSDVVTIEYLAAPEVEVTEGAELNCIQVTTTVSGYPSGGNGEFDFQWTTTDGHIISNPLSSTITVDAPGSYLLAVTDIISGCETFATAEVVSDIVLPDVDAGQSIPINCENLQVTLAGSGDTLNEVTWTTPNGNIVSGGSTYHPVVDASGMYYIEVLNPTTNCSNQDSVLVPDESAPATSEFQYLTSGLTMNGTDMSTGSNLAGWNWSFGDGNTSEEVNVVHTYAAAGIYQVCLSVQNGCGLNQSCQMVEVTSSGSVINVDAVITNVLCFGESTGSIILTVNGGSGVYTYVWTGADTTYSTPSIQDITAGAYQLVISDDEGNIFIGGYNVEQPSDITLEGSTVVDNLCFGETNGSITLDITGGVAPYLYSWNGSPPQLENFLNQLPGGTIQAVVTDANGCDLLAGPYTIFEPDQLVPQSQITNVLCHGDANGSISLSISGGVAPYSYLWSVNGNVEPTVQGLSAGNYSSTITDANGCSVVFEVVVSEPVVLQLNSIIVTDASGPDQNNGAITLDVAGGTAPYQVTWNNGATGTSISGLIPGEYNYVIIDANDCQYTSAVPVIVNFSTGTAEATWPEYVTITPNPTKGEVAIKWSELPFKNASLSILTMEGKLIESHTMSTTEGRWDLTPIGLSNGLYIILLKQDKQVFPFKLIVL